MYRQVIVSKRARMRARGHKELGKILIVVIGLMLGLKAYLIFFSNIGV